MFHVPVSFVGFRGEPRRYPRGTTSYRVTSNGTPGGWTYHESRGVPLSMDPFLHEPGMGLWNDRPALSYVPSKRPDWTENVVCTGFAPGEVTLKVSSDKVFIHCFHKDGDDENSDTREKKKTIVIPEDVESGDIKADMSEGGTMTLTAPYVQKEEAPNDADGNRHDEDQSKSSGKKEERNKGKIKKQKDGSTNIQITRS